MILGIDIGNSFIKSSEGVKFESKTTKIKPFSKYDELRIDGSTIYLGTGNRDTDYRKIEKSNYINFLYGAIALSTKDIRNKVVVGLPISQYQEDKNELINMILMNHKKNIEINGRNKTLIIEDVDVAPEGVVAINNDFNGIVVDIGGRTTDTCIVTSENGRRKIERPLTQPTGVLNLNNEFITLINGKFGLDLKETDANRIIQNGLKIYGQQQDIGFAINVFKEYVENLINLLQVEYSLKTYDIALVGGGSALLYKPFKKRLANARLLDNFFFANANGYKKVGKGVWSE